jgi:hypothetical protein
MIRISLNIKMRTNHFRYTLGLELSFLSAMCRYLIYKFRGNTFLVQEPGYIFIEEEYPQGKMMY